MKPGQKEKDREYAFDKAPAAQPSPRGLASAARLLPHGGTLSAASMAPAAEHPRAKPMVLGSMGTTAKQQRPSDFS